MLLFKDFNLKMRFKHILYKIHSSNSFKKSPEVRVLEAKRNLLKNHSVKRVQPLWLIIIMKKI